MKSVRPSVARQVVVSRWHTKQLLEVATVRRLYRLTSFGGDGAGDEGEAAIVEWAGLASR